VTRKPLIAGNWKMNLNHLEAIAHLERLAYTLRDEDFARVDVTVLPPFTDLRSVQTVVDGERLLLSYGAQDLSAHPAGAHTGDVSGAMLARLGCSYVIVGHSERRLHHAESDDDVAAKLRAAHRVELTPILCVGEPLEVRREGRQVEHCLDQLSAALAGLTAEAVGRVVLAYEPIWAIGTGEVATPDDAQQVCAALRGRLAELAGSSADLVRILYGGSVKADNIDDMMAGRDVDGALVGGASLDVDEFVRIVRFQP